MAIDQENKKITMRAVKEVSVEHVVEAEDGKIHLEGIIIAGKTYTLDIHNLVSKPGEERLKLNFNNGDYLITIDEKGVGFERIQYRPKHDHNDIEYFVIGINDEVMGVKKGEIRWFSQFPHKYTGRDFYKIQFDAVRVDY